MHKIIRQSPHLLIVFLSNLTPTIYNSKLIHACRSNLDVTKLYNTQERLQASEAKLVGQEQDLKSKTIALKELIWQVELEKNEQK